MKLFTLWNLELLASCFGLLSALWVTGWIVIANRSFGSKHLKIGAKAEPTDTRVEVRSLSHLPIMIKKSTPVRRTAMTIGRSLALLVAGYFANDLQTYYTTRPLSNVLILVRHDDWSYRMQTDQGQAFELTFCRDSPTDFEPGQKIKRLDYKQRSGCKSIHGKNLGFTMYVNPKGERELFLDSVSVGVGRPTLSAVSVSASRPR